MPIKKIAFLVMTMALAVAIVACQGAAGATASAGEPGAAAQLPPLTGRQDCRTCRLRHLADGPVGLFHRTRGRGADLFGNVVNGGRNATATVANMTLTVTAVAAGESTITVTATDTDKLMPIADVHGDRYCDACDACDARSDGRFVRHESRWYPGYCR